MCIMSHQFTAHLDYGVQGSFGLDIFLGLGFPVIHPQISPHVVGPTSHSYKDPLLWLTFAFFPLLLLPPDYPRIQLHT